MQPKIGYLSYSKLILVFISRFKQCEIFIIAFSDMLFSMDKPDCFFSGSTQNMLDLLSLNCLDISKTEEFNNQEMNLSNLNILSTCFLG